MKSILNCQVISRAVTDGIGYPKFDTEKCEGYVKSESDDEPCEKCKKCRFLEKEGADGE